MVKNLRFVFRILMTSVILSEILVLPVLAAILLFPVVDCLRNDFL